MPDPITPSTPPAMSHTTRSRRSTSRQTRSSSNGPQPGLRRRPSTFSAISTSALGGLLMGAGMLMLFRHQSSLGGFNVVALMLQERRGWRTGYVQLGMDAAVLVAAMAVTDGPRVLWSALGAVALNLALSFNHRPGRYLAAG